MQKRLLNTAKADPSGRHPLPSLLIQNPSLQASKWGHTFSTGSKGAEGARRHSPHVQVATFGSQTEVASAGTLIVQSSSQEHVSM